MIIYQHWYDIRINVTIFDIVLFIIFFSIFFLYSKRVSQNKDKKEYYKYFHSALILKIIAGLSFAIITLVFYPGDTFEYYKAINSLNNLLFQNPAQYFDILINGNKAEYWSYFNVNTGYPAGYMWRDYVSMFVVRLYSPLMLLTFKSFILSTFIASLIGFSGIWKLYQVLSNIYPDLIKLLAYSVLFFPSLIFWSSGIMKDTLTTSAIGWIVYAFYKFAILKQFKIKYIFILIIFSILIINIKAYVFSALLPGLFIWLFFRQIKAIKNKFIRFMIAPLLLIIMILGFSIAINISSSSMGDYGGIDSSIKRAQIIQQDLVRSEQYGDNYYDIGEFEATPIGILSKAPIAIVSGIFRPFIWEASNLFILLAGLESIFLMGLLLFVIFKQGLLKFVKIILQDPFLIFALIFVIIFAFGIGLASANFGALVRYKIPLIPFLLSSLFIILKHNLKTKDV